MTCYGHFILLKGRSQGFASDSTDYAPCSDSLSLRLRPFLGLNLASEDQLVGSLCKRHAVIPFRSEERRDSDRL